MKFCQLCGDNNPFAEPYCFACPVGTYAPQNGSIVCDTCASAVVNGSTTCDNGDGGSKDKTGLIVGLTIGGVVLVAGLTFAGYIIYRRRRFLHSDR